jgi:hypothetical protein
MLGCAASTFVSIVNESEHIVSVPMGTRATTSSPPCGNGNVAA